MSDKAYTYFATTSGMCRECRRIVRAQIVFEGGKVYQERICPEHGASRALIAADQDWYLAAVREPMAADKPRLVSTKVEKGCPFDCGICAFHEQKCNLPVFSITNACNLRCPICFTYNRKDKIYFKTKEEMGRLLDWIVEAAGPVDLINVTGGEPTLHPELLSLLELAKRPEIGRVTLNSNGLTLAKDPDLVKRLKDLGIYVILSFDTFDPETAKRIHGLDVVEAKLKALENLRKHDVPTTILNVLIKGVNDSELPRILKMALDEDFIRSLTVQTMTFTGYGGKGFSPREHITIDETEKIVEAGASGRIRASDFMPLPSAHPLCYGICYLFGSKSEEVVPLLRVVSKEELREALKGGYLLHPDGRFEKALKQGMDLLWANSSGSDEAAIQLKTLKGILKKLYPPGESHTVFERQKLGERHTKTIYVHAHMDEDNFDTARAVKCPDMVPDESRKLRPACTYNLFYRQKDERFWVDE
ncbi:MAG: radical SAM protein [Elusimicrobia bacterium]|nr:radical SAM protein [Elusimicrobiota bacterium]